MPWLLRARLREYAFWGNFFANDTSTSLNRSVQLLFYKMKFIQKKKPTKLPQMTANWPKSRDDLVISVIWISTWIIILIWTQAGSEYTFWCKDLDTQTAWCTTSRGNSLEIWCTICRFYFRFVDFFSIFFFIFFRFFFNFLRFFPI